MSTSQNVIQTLEQASITTRTAIKQIDDLIVEHDYQDVATLIAQAAEALLDAASQLMQSKDEMALETLDRADELLESVYAIIDGDVDDDE